MKDKVRELQDENLRLAAEVNSLKEKMTICEDQLKISRFSYERFKMNSRDIRFYTSFSRSDVLDKCFDFLNPGLNSENIVYWKSSVYQANEQMRELDIDEDEDDEEISKNIRCKQGRQRALGTKTEFFSVFVQSKTGI